MEAESSYEETRRLNMLANEEMMGQLGLSAGAKSGPHGAIGGGPAEQQQSAAAVEAVSPHSLQFWCTLGAGGGQQRPCLVCSSTSNPQPHASRVVCRCVLASATVGACKPLSLGLGWDTATAVDGETFCHCFAAWVTSFPSRPPGVLAVTHSPPTGPTNSVRRKRPPAPARPPRVWLQWVAAAQASSLFTRLAIYFWPVPRRPSLPPVGLKSSFRLWRNLLPPILPIRDSGRSSGCGGACSLLCYSLLHLCMRCPSARK
jgi:hypothetical protein